MILYIKFSTDGHNNWNCVINENNPNTLDNGYFNNRNGLRDILEYTVRRFSRAGRYISLELTHDNNSETATITFTHNMNTHKVDIKYDSRNQNFIFPNSDIVLTQQSLYNVMSSFYIFDKKEEETNGQN